jgi:hypothetical protein
MARMALMVWLRYPTECAPKEHLERSSVFA